MGHTTSPATNSEPLKTEEGNHATEGSRCTPQSSSEGGHAACKHPAESVPSSPIYASILKRRQRKTAVTVSAHELRSQALAGASSSFHQNSSRALNDVVCLDSDSEMADTVEREQTEQLADVLEVISLQRPVIVLQYFTIYSAGTLYL